MAKTACIRTSDRITFRKCRRLWNWTSPLRGNLTSVEAYTPFWLGHGIHFALEDFHGYNRFGSPSQAFLEFVTAFRKTSGLVLPDDWEDARDLAIGMMEHYLTWLKGRDPLETLWIDRVPQVEVPFRVEIPFETPEYDIVVHEGIIDRVAEDQHGSLWLVEYKSHKNFSFVCLPVDPQVSSYSWAMTGKYDKPIEGLIYQQHRKILPDSPTVLASGRISTNKTQATTRGLYKEALVNLYSDVSKAPAPNIDFLNWLGTQEDEHSDKFIKRTLVRRNQRQIESEGAKILQELPDMLNPDLPLYPTPTANCSWNCDCYTACVSFDDGSDWEHELATTMRKRTKEDERWRQYLPQ